MPGSPAGRRSGWRDVVPLVLVTPAVAIVEGGGPTGRWLAGSPSCRYEQPVRASASGRKTTRAPMIARSYPTVGSASASIRPTSAASPSGLPAVAAALVAQTVLVQTLFFTRW